MKRWLYAHHSVKGDPKVVEETLRRHIRALLLRATGTDDPDLAADGSFTVHLSTVVAGHEEHRDVPVQLGVADRPDRRLRIPIHWHAAHARRMFPTFAAPSRSSRWTGTGHSWSSPAC